jgi:hypothetical protein
VLERLAARTTMVGAFLTPGLRRLASRVIRLDGGNVTSVESSERELAFAGGTRD